MRLVIEFSCWNPHRLPASLPARPYYPELNNSVRQGVGFSRTTERVLGRESSSILPGRSNLATDHRALGPEGNAARSEGRVVRRGFPRGGIAVWARRSRAASLRPARPMRHLHKGSFSSPTW